MDYAVVMPPSRLARDRRERYGLYVLAIGLAYAGMWLWFNPVPMPQAPSQSLSIGIAPSLYVGLDMQPQRAPLPALPPVQHQTIQPLAPVAPPAKVTITETDTQFALRVAREFVLGEIASYVEKANMVIDVAHHIQRRTQQ
ncbi:MAG: hypothetical protein WAX89_06925 [Alphaproteobacteria bacterium]